MSAPMLQALFIETRYGQLPCADVRLTNSSLSRSPLAIIVDSMRYVHVPGMVLDAINLHLKQRVGT